MFQYYFLLGFSNLRRNPALTALMVLTLVIGVAASVSTLTILDVVSENPMPDNSAHVFEPMVDNDSKLLVWLALCFILLCLVNTVGLLLAKFSVRAAEVGIRRALGASRKEIFRQFLIETTVIGLAGGILGLLLAFGALALIGMQSATLHVVTHMDLGMLALTFTLSVLAALLAGLLPTWRACQVTPALQLKSQ